MLLSMDRNVIYALVDPRTSMVCYIGATKNPMSRYRQHLRMPRSEGAQKNQWVRELLDEGHKPLFVFLDVVSDTDVKSREIWWISHFKKLGALYNHSNISK